MKNVFLYWKIIFFKLNKKKKVCGVRDENFKPPGVIRIAGCFYFIKLVLFELFRFWKPWEHLYGGYNNLCIKEIYFV